MRLRKYRLCASLSRQPQDIAGPVLLPVVLCLLNFRARSESRIVLFSSRASVPTPHRLQLMVTSLCRCLSVPAPVRTSTELPILISRRFNVLKLFIVSITFRVFCARPRTIRREDRLLACVFWFLEAGKAPLASVHNLKLISGFGQRSVPSS